jgi:hypothetical protein
MRTTITSKHLKVWYHADSYDLYKRYDPDKDKKIYEVGLKRNCHDVEFPSADPFAYRTTSTATYLTITLIYYDHQNNYNGLSIWQA